MCFLRANIQTVHWSLNTDPTIGVFPQFYLSDRMPRHYFWQLENFLLFQCQHQSFCHRSRLFVLHHIPVCWTLLHKIGCCVSHVACWLYRDIPRPWKTWDQCKFWPQCDFFASQDCNYPQSHENILPILVLLWNQQLSAMYMTLMNLDTAQEQYQFH